MSNKKESSGKSVIKYEDGLKAAKIISDLAKENDCRIALCGGLALHVYGFTRATKDIDLLADKLLPGKQIRKLNFGGAAYGIKVGDVTIEVDVIIRNDEIKEIYELALNDAKVIKDIGIRVITPEYLVLLKYLAGRGKDQIDLMWMLRENDLVDRAKIVKIIKKQMGKHSYWALRDLEQLFLEADLLRARDERGE